MTEAKCVVAIIERDIAEKIPVTVMLHELLVLEAVHAKALIRPSDVAPLIESKEVDLEDEYDRLANQYGFDESGIPFVERVYGRLDEFVRKAEEIYSDHQGVKPKRASRQKVDDESNVG